MLNNLQQMHLELLQKEQFKKQQEQAVIWLVKKLLMQLRKFKKIHSKTLQRPLQMNMIKKYLKKDWRKDRTKHWAQINDGARGTYNTNS